MGMNVHLTPELERFAREVVAEGRYNNVSEVVRDGLRLLQDAAERKRKFMAMLSEVQNEVDRDGSVSIEEALVEFDRVVAEADDPEGAAHSGERKALAGAPPPTWRRPASGLRATGLQRRVVYGAP